MNQSKEEVNTITLPVKSRPTHNQLHNALMGIQDLLERSMLDFVLLGDTAKKISSDEMPNFDMEFIHIGIRRPYYNTSGNSTLHSLLKESHIEYVEDENHLFLDYFGTPVQIDIIDNYYSFLMNPDTRNYTITEFKIPNPMKEYLERINDVK